MIKHTEDRPEALVQVGLGGNLWGARFTFRSEKRTEEWGLRFGCLMPTIENLSKKGGGGVWGQMRWLGEEGIVVELGERMETGT